LSLNETPVPPKPTRPPEDVLEPLVGLVVAVTWASVGVRLVVADDPALVQQVVAGLVFAVAGVGLGVALGNLRARRARRIGRTFPAADAGHLGASALLLGPMGVGMGLMAVDPASTFAMVAAPLLCLAGGVTSGLFLVAGIARRSTSEAETSAPL
jgi:hypothetical protein